MTVRLSTSIVLGIVTLGASDFRAYAQANQAPPATPSVVHEDIEASLLVRDLFEQPPDGLLVRVVACHGVDWHLERGVTNRAAGGIDRRPCLREPDSDPATDAAAGSGDQGDL